MAQQRLADRLTVPYWYGTVDPMAIENEVLDLTLAGMAPMEIVAALEIRRHQYNAAISELENRSLLSRLGDLPSNASTETCPPPEAAQLFDAVFDSSGWSERTLFRVRSLCARYGWMEPAAPDSRYTRSRWSGQAVRRVDFACEGTEYTVYGFLVPRTDKKTWSRATPQYRIIYVETASGCRSQPMCLGRGRAISADVAISMIESFGVQRIITSTELRTSIAVAVAWVNESRAVLIHTI
jgi:hypothetical protein